jgi:peptide/nickel transport system permease protein
MATVVAPSSSRAPARAPGGETETGRRARVGAGAVRSLRRLVRGTGRALLTVVPVVFISTFGTFALGALGGSNPAAEALGETATPEAIAQLNHALGLDRPLLVQYWDWITSALHGDLGTSYFTGIPVSTSIAMSLPVDLALTLFAIVLAVLVGGAAGIASALRAGSRLDRGVTFLASAAGTVPAFIIGIGLIVVFSVTLQLLPAGGFVPFTQDPAQWLKFLILPSVALSIGPMADVARQLRNSLVGALGENFVVGAEVRGLSRHRVVFRHALRNASGPTLTVLGIQVPVLIGGAVITETLFNLPGMGKLTLDAANRHDIPVIQGTLLVSIGLVLVANLLVNVALVRLRPQAKE